jgi:hypothetical protein
MIRNKTKEGKGPVVQCYPFLNLFESRYTTIQNLTTAASTQQIVRSGN